jgi:hypothetical protein
MEKPDRDPHKAVDHIIKHAKRFADDKAQRVFLEEFRKSKKALLMKQSLEPALGAQERDAYAHPEYIELLKGLKEAVEIEEKLRWDLIAAQARIEIFRTESANNRMIDRSTM